MPNTIDKDSSVSLDLLVKVRSAWNNKNGSRSLNSGLPVMVWIHGGKFDSGSSLPRSQAQDNWISGHITQKTSIHMTFMTQTSDLNYRPKRARLLWRNYCGHCSIPTGTLRIFVS